MFRLSFETFRQLVSLAPVVSDAVHAIVTAVREARVTIARPGDDGDLTPAEAEAHYQAFVAEQQHVAADAAGRIETRHEGDAPGGSGE